MEETDTTTEKGEENSPSNVYSPTEAEQELVEKWKKRFKRADEYMKLY